MSIDRYDWHYDSAAEAYRDRNNITGELTDEQSDEVCLYAADHIGLFLRWIIENHFEGEESDPEGCVLVRKGEITGAEYLMEYYESEDKNRPFQYFADLVEAIGEENIYQKISGDKEYNALKPLIDRAYKGISKQEK